MRIPFLDLRRQLEEIGAEADEALRRVLRGGAYILGPEVAAFEEEWARFCGARFAAGVGNGTDAITLALLASGAVRPGAGDEVVTTPLTAAYTALAILNAGAVPVFADVDPDTLTLDPAALEAAITPRTRAVVPVHLYGQTADIGGIYEVAARRDLFILEDAAQAHGASYRGKLTGGLGFAAAFSFYPTKNLGAYGDGGAVTSNNEELIERVKTLRQGGHAAALGGEVAGLNSRLDEAQAAVLRVKLARLEDWNQRRRRIAALYQNAFAGTSITTPLERGPFSHVYHLYVVRHPDRDRLREHLAARGVETLIHYPYLLHQQTLFTRQRAHPPLPTAERAAAQILSLPLYPHLRDDEVQTVIDAVLEFFGK